MIRNRFIVMSSIAIAMGVALTGEKSAQATVSFDFSFNDGNGLGSTPGTVTGVISGPPSSGTGPAADVTLLSAPAALGNSSSLPIDLAQAGWTFSANSFTVSNDTITGGDFAAESNAGSFALIHATGSGAVDLLSLDSGNTEVFNGGGLGAVTFSPAPVPEPASFAVFGIPAALVALRRHPRKLA